MKKKLLRYISLMLVLVLTLSLTAYANVVWDYYPPDFPFTDVPHGEWYTRDVYYAYNRNLMVGVSDTEFGPHDNASRAMIATIFWRMEGSPEPTAHCTFTDVAENAWYAKSVSWMQEVGLTAGSGHNRFSPNASITREELATFFYRYANYKYNITDPIMGDISVYEDNASVSDWAKDAMSWSVGEYIIYGVGNNRLAPQNTAQRCEIAAIMRRFLETDFTQKRVVRIEATGDPEKLICPVNCGTIIFWEHVVVTGYFSDGSVEIIPRQGELPWVGMNMDTSKLGPSTMDIYVQRCHTTLTFTVVEALPYVPIDVEAAMAYGNEYAESLGYKIDYEYTTDTAGYGPPNGLSVNIANKYGGQTALLNAVKEAVDTFYDRDIYLEETCGQKFSHVRVYIEFVHEWSGNIYDEYWVYVLG